MAEYIDREAVLRDWPPCDEPADAYQFIRGFPAADVRPVVHGFNMDAEYHTLFTCSVCGWSCFDTVPGDTEEYNFCPNCGADMRQRLKEESR